MSLWIENRDQDSRCLAEGLGGQLWDGQALSGPGRLLLDVWTAEVDPRLQGLPLTRSCFGDWLLEHHGPSSVAISGTAGKTTTTWLVVQLLQQMGSVAYSQARAANLWPTSALLDRLQHPWDWLVLELTSSHLAFCHRSPRVAALTNFWPDHLELHGGLEAYRAAKARLFAHQTPQDWAVLPADDPSVQELAQGSSAQRLEFSCDRPVPWGCWLEGSRVHWNHGAGSGQDLLWPQGDPLLARSLLCALTVVLACCGPARLGQLDLTGLKLPPHRRQGQGWIDDTLAATPIKALAGLIPGAWVVAGGLLEIAGQRVHQSPAEREQLQGWLKALREQARGVSLFGPAGQWLAQQHPDWASFPTWREALEAVRGEGPVLVSPGFPMEQADRLQVQQALGLQQDFLLG